MTEIPQEAVEFEGEIDEPLNDFDPDSTDGDLVEEDDIHPPNEDEEPVDDLTE